MGFTYEEDDDMYWVDIPGHPNHECTIYGDIRNKHTKRVLNGRVNSSGYKEVWLSHDRRYLAHRLICETFYGPPEDDKMQVNHLDSDRLNNRLLNLAWCTPSENIRHGVKYGNIDPYKGLTAAREANIKPVRIVETGQVFASLQDCANFLGVTRGNISRVLSGERKGQRIHGFRIEYIREEDM